MKYPTLICLLLVTLLLVGCITPQAQNNLDAHASNAVSMNKQVQELDFYTKAKDGTYTPAPWVKVWWGAEEKTLSAIAAWGHGKRATPTTQH